ncbi:sphingomyelin phosphodiesterase [Auriculariales sp. MPI-PUGE-AT-0066]|nr:sphingomyelin phosphodiesterase [Auriculariales sp. MPI-PUGE-AT-0066]
MRVPANATLFLRAQQLRLAAASPSAVGVSSLTWGPSTFTAAGTFPTDAYEHYYNDPTQTTAQVQPVITDPVSNKVYPLELTDPFKFPKSNTVDEHLFPPPAPKPALVANALRQIDSIANSPHFPTTCSKCIASLEIAKFVVLAAPEMGPELAIALCVKYSGVGSLPGCTSAYNNGIGAVITQVASFADVGGYDGQMLCYNFLSLCPLPPAAPLDLDKWFKKPKPDPLPAPKRSGKRVKVLHLSDFHLDPRYANGVEAACDSGLCCRVGAFNSSSPQRTVLPAPRFGAWRCDTPLALGMAALEAIPALTKTEDTGFAWSIYTGDLVSHDSDNQLSRDYIMYIETLAYDLMRRYLGTGPMYAALGNHDSYNQAQDSPHALGGKLENQYSWHYDHVAALWQHESWLPSAAVASARAHYGGYSVHRQDGLRVITLNTDMWYPANYFAFINMTADTSGMLRFLTDELQDAEDVGERVWIIGHVLTGWDGSNTLIDPSNLFYQIVDRYSPHVIANIFFGHTHEDQFSIYYTNNATEQSSEAARAVAWIGPSLTPVTGLNSGFRVYEVDSGSFEIMDAHTWISNVSTFASLEGQTEHGPAYTYEYSSREVYGKTIEWGADEPLNATWWHRVTEAMEQNPTLVQTFTQLQSKSSDRTPPCTSKECVEAKICYMRSGSACIAKQNCQQGFGSVQGWP